MTKGNVLSQILKFALPLLIGNLFQQAYSMVDAAIVGLKLGANALGAVGVSSSAQFLILGFCIGTSTGFAIPVATSFGANKNDDVKAYVYHGALLTILLAIVVTIVTSLTTGSILSLLKTPSDLFDDAYAYLLIIFLGIPFLLLYNFCASILRSVGDTKTPFYYMIVSSLLNIGLDLLCINVFEMGVIGAAIATVIAQAVSGILCVCTIRKRHPLLCVNFKQSSFEAKKAKYLFALGLPMGLQFSITAIGSMVQQSANNALGTICVDGFSAGVKIKQFASCPFEALAAALSTFVSQNKGANQMKRIKEGLRKGNVVACLYGLFIGCMLYFYGRNMSMLFVGRSHVEVLDASYLYLSRMGLCYWVLGILIVTRSSVQGLGFSKHAFFAGVIEMIARVLSVHYLVPVYGYLAICWIDQIAWIFGTIYIVWICKMVVLHMQEALIEG